MGRERRRGPGRREEDRGGGFPVRQDLEAGGRRRLRAARLSACACLSVREGVLSGGPVLGSCHGQGSGAGQLSCTGVGVPCCACLLAHPVGGTSSAFDGYPILRACNEK